MRAWGAALLLAGAPTIAAAQADLVTPVRAVNRSPGSVSSVERPAPRLVPMTGGQPDNWPQLKRIYYPPDPPPLGATINFDLNRTLLQPAPGELAAYVTEPFYAPLSTYFADFSPAARKKLQARVAAYVPARERLLTEIRAVIEAQAAAPAEERVAAWAELASRQARTLEALETEAEALRQLLARKANWFEHREWKLDSGPLRPRLPEHAVLEFQVVRAAAFYLEGLLPAQRRLLRESAMQMQDAMFVHDAEDSFEPAAPPAPALMFFSPDLARIIPLANLPDDAARLVDEFAAEKNALRDELTAAIIANDKARFASNRRRVLADIARQQAPRLTALEVRAEEIRRALAPVLERHRAPRPNTLPPEILKAIDEYLAQRASLARRFEGETRAAVARAAAELAPGDRAQWHDQVVGIRQDVAESFSRKHQGELKEMDARLERIHGMLVAWVGEGALTATNVSGDTFLVDFLQQYRQEWMAYEYTIAVFEPGLSPAQRRLLLGGAVRRMELPLPAAERQPMALPLTLLAGRKLE